MQTFTLNEDLSGYCGQCGAYTYGVRGTHVCPNAPVVRDFAAEMYETELMIDGLLQALDITDLPEDLHPADKLRRIEKELGELEVI